MAAAERWFDRHGSQAVLLGRLTPLVRSFISIPAGVFGSPFAMYATLTTIGSAIWCFGFAGAGWALGSQFDVVHRIVELGEILLVAAAAVAALTFWRRRRA
jgi:membrane protein DedA with SNARE-associated domain